MFFLSLTFILPLLLTLSSIFCPSICFHRCSTSFGDGLMSFGLRCGNCGAAWTSCDWHMATLCLLPGRPPLPHSVFFLASLRPSEWHQTIYSVKHSSQFWIICRISEGMLCTISHTLSEKQWIGFLQMLSAGVLDVLKHFCLSRLL